VEADAAVACVLGDMDLVRPLALAGVKVVAMTRHRDPPRYSRHVSASLDLVDHWTDPDVLVERLLRFGVSQGTPPVLFYQSTGDLLTISRHRERLREAFRFIVADGRLVEDLTDKARFRALAERLRLPVPATRHLRPAADRTGWDVDLRFPVIVKPITRHFEQWSKVEPAAKAIRVDSSEAMRKLWPRLAAATIEVLAQELIIGPETSIESYHTYVDDAGRVAAEFAGKKIRTRPAEFGYSTAVVLTDAQDVIALGRDVVARLGLVGVAKLDFKRAPGGELFLLEVNPRFTLWHHPAAVGGLNIPAIVFADLTGRPRPSQAPPRRGVRWCDPWEDAAASRALGELNAGWLLSALTCQAKSGFSWDDPMPFVRGVVLPKLKVRARRRMDRYLGDRRSTPAVRAPNADDGRPGRGGVT
jgi:predicted ATP-grasp superfamily ATP-dependent carboligase